MQNNATISALVVSQILPELVVIVTKDNKIKLVNIDKGESYKSIAFSTGDDTASQAYPLEMTILERDSKPCNALLM
jgi:hypothetical protein